MQEGMKGDIHADRQVLIHPISEYIFALYRSSNSTAYDEFFCCSNSEEDISTLKSLAQDILKLSISLGFYPPLLTNLVDKTTSWLSLMTSSSWLSILLIPGPFRDTSSTLDLFLTSNSSTYIFKLYSPLALRSTTLSQCFLLSLLDSLMTPRKGCFWYCASWWQ